MKIVCFLIVYLCKTSLYLLVLTRQLARFYVCSDWYISSLKHCCFSHWTIIYIAIRIERCINFSWTLLLRIRMLKFLIIFQLLSSLFYIFNNILFLILLLIKIYIFLLITWNRAKWTKIVQKNILVLFQL